MSLGTFVRNRLARRREAGYAALLVAVLTSTVFMGCAAMGVDVSRWYVVVQKVQKAADAAATAGVTYLPDDFTQAAATAIRVAGLNGFTNGDGATIAVSVGDKPTQLRVTVSTTVQNAFGAVIGLSTSTISRSATADFVGPVPMGSPCNSFGNESDPKGINNDSYRGPSSKVTVQPSGGATCGGSTFWGAVAGPDTPKGNGDQYMTRSCASGTDGCSGTKNTDFKPEGYFYVVRVGSGAVGHALTLQLYDPAWVSTGDTCEKSPSSGISNGMNPYAPDATTRYPASPTTYCTGDVDNSESGTDYPIVTSYGLRAPTDTHAPLQAAPMLNCAKQYAGYSGYQPNGNVTMKSPWGLSASTLNSYSSSYRKSVAQVFHQWLTLCTFTPSAAGDYYLQVRTDVKLGTTSDGQGGITAGSNIFTQSGDDTSVHGNGNNRFAIRVVGDTSAEAAVSVAGWDHMAIYANYTAGSPQFNLVRVIPAAATKTLDVNFFDVGDASAPGTVQILPPSDSNLGSTLSSCLAAGVVNGTVQACKLSNVSSSNYNGKMQHLYVQIPSSYTCTSTQPGGCWFRVKMTFPSGLNDTTTWSAEITGDPVRLIE